MLASGNIMSISKSCATVKTLQADHTFFWHKVHVEASFTMLSEVRYNFRWLASVRCTLGGVFPIVPIVLKPSNGRAKQVNWTILGHSSAFDIVLSYMGNCNPMVIHFVFLCNLMSASPNDIGMSDWGKDGKQRQLVAIVRYKGLFYDLFFLQTTLLIYVLSSPSAYSSALIGSLFLNSKNSSYNTNTYDIFRSSRFNLNFQIIWHEVLTSKAPEMGHKPETNDCESNAIVITLAGLILNGSLWLDFAGRRQLETPDWTLTLREESFGNLCHHCTFLIIRSTFKIRQKYRVHMYPRRSPVFVSWCLS